MEQKRARTRGGAAYDESLDKRADAHLSFHNPSVEQLNYVASAYVNRITDKPSLFTGAIPEGWTAPPGVHFGQDASGGYIMHEAFDDSQLLAQVATLIPGPAAEVKRITTLRASFSVSWPHVK